MKRILITGANSYIGTSFENYMKQWPDEYHIDTVDMIDGSWRKKSFTGYDTVFHVAGIAHQKETKKNRDLYYKVNRDLAIETVKKAKADGVQQFIFMSSMSVYGMDTGVITRDTKPNPKSNYGKSKLQAEEGIKDLADDDFNIAVLRPPMVYGKGCKGNFQSVVKIVEKFPFFPLCNNKRSMIYIDNLLEFIKLLIDINSNGLFFPQNKDYMNTVDMAKFIATALGKPVHLSKMAGYGVFILRPYLSMLKKAFGDLIYSETEEFEFSYNKNERDFSIKASINE